MVRSAGKDQCASAMQGSADPQLWHMLLKTQNAQGKACLLHSPGLQRSWASHQSECCSTAQYPAEF